jgi:protease-4
MKTKQLIAIIVTGVVILVVGVLGVASNVVANKMIEQGSKDTASVLESFLGSGSSSEVTLPDGEFIGVVNIVGEIGESSSSTLSSSSSYNHDMLMNYIDEMEKSSKNKGILLYVDSPGGAVYQSDEMYLKLMEYKEQTNRPIWAYFASEACSGGYYISMAADKIYANRNCWTGSIGVIVSLMNCKDLYDKLGIKEIDITSGKNKAMGSTGLDLTDEQYDILQSLVDEAYDQFVGIVSTGRGLDETTVRKLADGRIYSAKQAKEKQLIDEIGSLEEEKTAFTQELGCDSSIEFYAPENTVGNFFSTIFGAVKSIMPKSEVELATDIVENKGNGVLKYYAQ